MAKYVANAAALLTSGIIIASFIRTSAHILFFSSTPACVSAFAFTNVATRARSTLARSRRFTHFRHTYNYNCNSHKYSSKHEAHRDFSFLLKDKPLLPTEELISKAEIDYITALVQRRSDARKSGDYTSADSLRDVIDAISREGGKEEEIRVSLPAGYKIEIKDIPRNEGGGSNWSLTPISNGEDNKSKESKKTGITVLGLAHVALGLASSSSERGVPIDNVKLNGIVLQAKQRLLETGEQELRGRTAADAIFWFALAGVSDDRSIGIGVPIGESASTSLSLDFSLFDALTFICLKELSRFGDRSSCRPTDIMHMVERIAAAGGKSEIFVRFQQEAARCLEEKNAEDIHDLVQRGVIETLHRGEFELHSERSLLWIWRFSTKQRKQRAFLKSAAKHWDSEQNKVDKDVPVDGDKTLSSLEDKPHFSVVWDTVFKDPTRPLVVDIGCGMGVSILGLSTMGIDRQMNNSMIDIDWDRCNFLGADLSRIGINFASSITKRWGLSDNVHFTMASAEEVMEHVAKTYPGKVKLCMIQFPTPFRFNDEATESKEGEVGLTSAKSLGNMQLPTDAFSGFMVTKRLIESTCSALNKDAGFLLLQSNCEDVAVFMNRLASDSGFEPLPSKKSVDKIHDANDGMPQRTKKWIALGGERAEGLTWNSDTVLPSIRGATETEVACLLNGTPVHRVLLVKK